ncbi:MAG: glycosyltransferase [Bacteroidota bacterium]
MHNNNENIVINGLWIGSKLSNVEMLCIHSYLKNGHSFVLWAYDAIENKLPDGVIVKDASEIIPREKVFSYKNTNQFGHGKGSYAGFSDIFRYNLLYEHGGWWTDMDVTCLKPFDFPEPYVFRTHHDLPMVGNIMKCPKGSELMKQCFDEASVQIDENNTDWHKPIQILNDNIVKLGLSGYVLDFTNHDSWNYIRKLLIKNVDLPKEWYAVHWINEEWRRNKVDKNIFYKNSTLGKLCRKYMPDKTDILADFSIFKRFKFSYANATFKQIKSRLSG